MGLGINQNLAATGILKNLSNTQSMFNTQVQRLSSGLRINSAADDPAGLVNSEKYRAQVDGLGQAIRNAKDGVNLVQTAEGALDEISSALRSMRTLALHAANTGVNDAASVAADQDQIVSLKGTIDRIVGNTQFGSRKLLDGSAGVTATTTNAETTFVSGTTSTQSGTYNVQVTTLATKGASRAAAMTLNQLTAANATVGALAGGAATATLTFSSSNQASGLLGAASVIVDIAGAADLNAVRDLVNNSTVKTVHGITASVSNNKLVFTSDRLSGGAASELGVVSGGTDANVAAFTGIAADGVGNVDAAVAANANSKIRNTETLDFADGNKAASVQLTSGMTVTQALSAINAANTGAGIALTAALAGSAIEFTNGAFGSQSAVQVTFKSNLVANSTGATFNLGVGTTALNVAAGNNGGSAGVNIAGIYIDLGSNTNLTAVGSGLTLTGNQGGADGLAVALSVAGNTVGDHGNVVVTGNSLTMQIGAFANQTATLTINNMGSNKLGVVGSASVSTIDVTSQAGATEALNVLDQAIADVSTVRASLGSFQKDTLETTVRNSLVAQQNIRTTESTIRDADIAEETLAFSKAQILQQTGIAMLAQANQAPQQLLALFR